MMSKKLQNAQNLYFEGVRDGYVRSAAVKYTGERLTQHHTGVKDGLEGFVEYFEDFTFRYKSREIQILRCIEDGSFVFLQVYQNLNQGELECISYDLFDTDENDLLVEHWNISSPIVFQANEAVQTLTPPTSTIHPPPKPVENMTGYTEKNKCVIRDFLREVMVLGKGQLFNHYLHLDQYHYHGPNDLSDLEHLCGHYLEVFKVIGQGDVVVSYSRVEMAEGQYARFDVFRLQDSLIVEHWINQERIPPKEQWVNGGKF